MNNDYIYPLPKSTYLKFAKEIYAPLKFGENSVILCPTLNWGRDRRLRQLKQQPYMIKEVLNNICDRYKFIDFHLSNNTSIYKDDWLGYIFRSLEINTDVQNKREYYKKEILKLIGSGKEISILINISNTVDDKALIEFFDFIYEFFFISPPRIHLQIILDKKWNHDKWIELISPFPSLFQNVSEMSMPSDTEIEYFVGCLSKRWNYKFSDELITFIVLQAGGVMYFAKAIVRMIIKQQLTKVDVIKDKMYSDETIKSKLATAFDTFIPRQKKLLKIIENITPKQEIKYKEDIAYLNKIQVIIKNRAGYEIRSKLLSKYLRQNNKRKIVNINNSIENSEVLSKREKRILRKLTESVGKVLTRDAIAEIIWGNDWKNNYSDWAIDKAMSRIRKKITEEEFKNIVLKTKKKMGFVIEFIN